MILETSCWVRPQARQLHLGLLRRYLRGVEHLGLLQEPPALEVTGAGPAAPDVSYTLHWTTHLGPELSRGHTRIGALKQQLDRLCVRQRLRRAAHDPASPAGRITTAAPGSERLPTLT